MAVRPVTPDLLRETEAWKVRLPGSRLLDESAAQQGEPHGFDLMFSYPFVSAVWWVPLPWSAVVAAYRDQLVTRRWSMRRWGSSATDGESWQFAKANLLALLTHMPVAPTNWKPRVGVPAGGTQYRIYVREGTRATTAPPVE